jgi:hypothetical protein
MSSNSLLEEKYAWVDARLEELYHGYALTMDNWEDFYDAGLLTENWSWVDAELEKQYDFLPCPAPVNWVRYRSYDRQHSIESESEPEQRPRAESDISDYSDDVDRALNRMFLKDRYYNYCMAIADECSSSINLNSDSEGDEELDYEFNSTYGWY